MPGSVMMGTFVLVVKSMICQGWCPRRPLVKQRLRARGVYVSLKVIGWDVGFESVIVSLGVALVWKGTGLKVIVEGERDREIVIIEAAVVWEVGGNGVEDELPIVDCLG
jgi:hypothetical protein